VQVNGKTGPERGRQLRAVDKTEAAREGPAAADAATRDSGTGTEVAALSEESAVHQCRHAVGGSLGRFTRSSSPKSPRMSISRGTAAGSLATAATAASIQSAHLFSERLQCESAGRPVGASLDSGEPATAGSGAGGWPEERADARVAGSLPACRVVCVLYPALCPVHVISCVV